MPAQATQIGSVSVLLDEDERMELLQMVRQALGDTRIEVHRTHTPAFREHVLHREELLRRLITKLGHMAS